MPICWRRPDEQTSPICINSCPIARRWPSGSALTRDPDSLIQMQTHLVNQLTACRKRVLPCGTFPLCQAAATLQSDLPANLSYFGDGTSCLRRTNRKASQIGWSHHSLESGPLHFRAPASTELASYRDHHPDEIAPGPGSYCSAAASDRADYRL